MYEPIVTKTVRILVDQLIQLRKNSKTVVNMAPHVHLFAMDTCRTSNSLLQVQTSLTAQ